METEKTYTEADLVKFGKYLFSDERKKRTRKEMQKEITDADLQNFK
jgi:hypothetical protein